MKKWLVAVVLLATVIIGYSFNSFIAAVWEMNPGVSAMAHECCDFRAHSYDANIFAIASFSFFPVLLVWILVIAGASVGFGRIPPVFRSYFLRRFLRGVIQLE